MASVSGFLPRFFHWVFAILEVLAGLAALAFCTIMLVNPHLPPDAHFGPIVAMIGGQPGTVQLTPAGGDHTLVITAFKGAITFVINQAGGFIEVLKHYGLPLMLLRALFAVALFELLRRLFRNVERRESFTPGTIRLVQFVGVLLIAASVVFAIADSFFATAAVSYFASHTVITVSGTEVRLPQHVYMHPHGFIFNPLVFSGLLVLALSEVFRQGLALKSENELTI